MSLLEKIRGGGRRSGTRKTVTFGDAAEACQQIDARLQAGKADHLRA